MNNNDYSTIHTKVELNDPPKIIPLKWRFIVFFHVQVKAFQTKILHSVLEGCQKVNFFHAGSAVGATASSAANFWVSECLLGHLMTAPTVLSSE
jgi:hypothetical protein